MTDPRVEEILEDLYLAQVEGEPAGAQALPEVIASAARAGYLQTRDGAAALTEPGRLIARDVVRRHRLAECLLHDVLAVSDEQIDSDACQFEHVIRPGVEERICALLGHPLRCPHGKHIPPGLCCLKARGEGARQVGPLCDGNVGDEGVVAYLRASDRQETQKLMAIGVLPGVAIRLVRRSPCYVFQVAYSQFTVDRDLASKIFVRWRQAEK